MSNKMKLDLDTVEAVNGGNIGFNPEAGGTYTMKCGFTGLTFTGVSLENVMEMIKYGATVPNTEEGEYQIINWAKSKGYIS